MLYTNMQLVQLYDIYYPIVIFFHLFKTSRADACPLYISSIVKTRTAALAVRLALDPKGDCKVIMLYISLRGQKQIPLLGICSSLHDILFFHVIHDFHLL